MHEAIMKNMNNSKMFSQSFIVGFGRGIISKIVFGYGR